MHLTAAYMQVLHGVRSPLMRHAGAWGALSNGGEGVGPWSGPVLCKSVALSSTRAALCFDKKVSCGC
jgi:hypothetical protein